EYLGSFEGEDTILVIQSNGSYLLTSYELTNRYETDNILIIRKFDPDEIFTVVHYDAEADNIFVKRFRVETQTTGKPFFFISESQGSRLLLISAEEEPIVEVEYLKGRKKEKFIERINLADFIDVKGWKARGNRLSAFTVSGVRLIQKTEEESMAEGHDNGENPEEEDHGGKNYSEQGPLDEAGHFDTGNPEGESLEVEDLGVKHGRTESSEEGIFDVDEYPEVKETKEEASKIETPESKSPEVENLENEHPEGDLSHAENNPLYEKNSDKKNRKEQLRLFDKA
ncbi:MAG: hypothetical protein ACMUHX_08895, partial [bacterium]